MQYHVNIVTVIFSIQMKHFYQYIILIDNICKKAKIY